jgi:ribosomal protein L35AE/L33A
MSNQLQITGGAKVRNLEGVLTGTSGVVSSLGINVPSGIPQLDGSGKILVSQLPNSVMEYKGTWNAATNTPTLANGTGNAGDVYLCDTAGTVNFGDGPITFSVGDQVLYSGTIWQRASGATGTVTSVAVTESGDALTITGSPITTAGTINIGFAGTGSQYIKGDGTLATFPTTIDQAKKLITEVYNSTGATLTKGTVVYINGGQGNLPTVTKAQANSDANSAQTYGVIQSDITNMNNGYVVVFGSITDIDTQAYTVGTQLYLSGTTAGAWTSTKPSAPIHLVYVGIVVRSHPTQGVVEVRIQNGYELEELHDVAITSVANNDGIFYNSSNSLWENKTIAEVLGYTPANDSLVVKLAGTQTITGQKTFTSLIYANNNIVLPIAGSSSITYLANIAGTGMTSSGANYIGFNTNNDFYFAKDNYHSCVFVSNNSAVNYYTLQDGSGTLAFTSDIPSLTNYVTLNTLQTITGVKFFNAEASFDSNIVLTGGDFVIGNSGFDTSINTETLTASRSINFPNKSGVVAMTSDIPSLSGYVQGSGTTNYHAKFTASGTIGNSVIYDNGTSAAIGGTTITDSNLLNLIGNQSSVNVGIVFNNTNGTFPKIYGIQNINNSLVFYDYSANTTRMTLTTAGNFGIGTGSPLTTFSVAGANGVTDSFGQAYIYSTDSQAADKGGQITMGGLFSSSRTAFGFIAARKTNSTSGDSQGYLVLGTNSGSALIERLRITTGGTLQQPVPSNDGLFFTIPTNSYTGYVYSYVNNNGGSYYLGLERSIGSGLCNNSPAYSTVLTTNNATALSLGTNGLERLRIISSGNMILNSVVYNNSTGGSPRTLYIANDYYIGGVSSIRASKKNIENISDVDWIYKLSPVTFNYRKKDEEGNYLEETYKDLNYGLIAEDTAPVADFLINYNNKEDGTKEMIGIEYPRLITPLLKAIQDQKKLIDELSAKVSALENK